MLAKPRRSYDAGDWSLADRTGSASVTRGVLLCEEGQMTGRAGQDPIPLNECVSHLSTGAASSGLSWRRMQRHTAL